MTLERAELRVSCTAYGRRSFSGRASHQAVPARRSVLSDRHRITAAQVCLKHAADFSSDRLFCLFLLVFILSILPASPSLSGDTSAARELNRRGERFLQKGNYRDAINVFNQMLDECGSNDYCTGVAKFYIGRAHREIGQYEIAMRFLDDADALFSRLKKPNEHAMVTSSKGKVLAGRGEYKAALDLFDQAEEVFKSTDNNKELFLLYNDVAVVYGYLSEYARAVEYLDKAASLIKTTRDSAQLGALNNNRGLISAKTQQYDDAAKHYEAALKHYKESGNINGMSVVLNNLGRLAASRSDYQEALEQYKESLRLAREIRNASSEALALNNIGCAQMRRGNYEDALEAFESSLMIRQDLGIKHQAAETMNNRGLIWLAYADWPLALQDFQEALKVCKEVGSLSGQAWALHNQAFLYKDQGKLKDSGSSSLRAIAIARKIGDRRLEATARLRLGKLYEYQGLFDNALKEYNRAAQIQREIGDGDFLANTLADMAGTLARRGAAGEAESSYQEALRLKRKIGAPCGNLLCKLAVFYMERPGLPVEGDAAPGKDEKAGDRPTTTEKCIALAESEIRPELVLDNMLLTYVKGKHALKNDAETALQRFTELKKASQTASIRKFSFLAAVGLGLAYEQQGNWEGAVTAFKQAIDYVEYIRGTLDPYGRLTFLDGEVVLGVKHIAPYEGLARVLMKKGDWAESMKWAEYTKARAFAESFAARWDSVFFDVPKDVIDRDLKLDYRLSALMRRQSRAYELGASGTIRSLNERIGRLKEERKRHLDELREKYPLFAVTKYPEPIDLQRSALRPDEWVLAYDVTDSGLLTYLMKGKNLVKACFKPLPRSRLDALVRTFREPLEVQSGRDSLQKKLKSFDFSAGKKLADLLLGPVLDTVPESVPLVVVPDDSLGVLPFEMLVLSDSGAIVGDGDRPYTRGAKFLADRNPVSYYQSVTALTLVRVLGRKKPPPRRLLVMADPVFQQSDARSGRILRAGREEDERVSGASLMSERDLTQDMSSLGIPRLPLTGNLAKALHDLFPDNSDMYTGTDATKENFVKHLGPMLDRYGKIVIATHGYFGQNLPGIVEPVLILTLIPSGVDGLLRASDVMGLKLNCDIVALTACQTGLGKQISGEGTMGMGRAFQFAGARSVLMSLWAVSERPSVQLVTLFFKHLKEGKPKLEALTLARRELRNRGFDHPFFWASFVLVGETG